MFYTYILYSSKSHIYYYGYSADLKARLESHNKGLNFATKPHVPWVLAWYCAFPTEQQAEDFELYLKSGSGKAFAYKRLVNLKAFEKDSRSWTGVPKP